jgi:hypothetical protein
MSDYRQGLDGWLDLLNTYAPTTHNYTLCITDTHRLVFSVLTVSTSRFLAADLSQEV